MFENEKYKFYFLLIIYILELYIDFKLESECFNKLKKLEYCKLWLNLIIHHIVSTFLIFGFIFDNKILLCIHLFTIILVVCHQILIKFIFKRTNKTLCSLTILKNYLCNDTKGYNHLLPMLKINKFFIIIIMFISLYKYYN